jgi:hypothetical protein
MSRGLRQRERGNEKNGEEGKDEVKRGKKLVDARLMVVEIQRRKGGQGEGMWRKEKRREEEEHQAPTPTLVGNPTAWGIAAVGRSGDVVRRGGDGGGTFQAPAVEVRR